MDGEADALALDDARLVDSVTCEGCGASVYCSEHVLSPYDADDGGAYCIDCAQREWARVVEEAARYRAALGEIERVAAASILLSSQTAPVLSGGLERIVIRCRAALAPAAGEGAGDGNG